MYSSSSWAALTTGAKALATSGSTACACRKRLRLFSSASRIAASKRLLMSPVISREPHWHPTNTTLSQETLSGNGRSEWPADYPARSTRALPRRGQLTVDTSMGLLIDKDLLQAGCRLRIVPLQLFRCGPLVPLQDGGEDVSVLLQKVSFSAIAVHREAAVSFALLVESIPRPQQPA